MADARRRISFAALCAGLAFAAVASGVRAAYGLGVHIALAAVPLALIGLSGWMLGGSAFSQASQDRRRLAFTGALLVAPIALLALLAGAGAPESAAHWQNQLRYVVFLLNTVLAATGLVQLGRLLGESGERLYSTLGVTAISIGAPVYFLWAAIWAGAYLIGFSSSADVPPAVAKLTDLADVFLFVGSATIYLACAAFATALGTLQWLGRKARLAIVATCLIAVLGLALRGLDVPEAAWALRHWLMIPGFLAGTPEVSWIAPCVLGLLLLLRAGDERIANSE
jgi:hypothetical protein